MLFLFNAIISSFLSCYWWQFQFYLLYRIGKISKSSIFKWLNHNLIPKCKIRIIIRPYSVYNKSNRSVRVSVVWNDASRQLIIGARKGAYKGMLNNRKFTIVLQDGTRKVVDYKGKRVSVKF